MRIKQFQAHIFKVLSGYNIHSFLGRININKKEIRFT